MTLTAIVLPLLYVMMFHLPYCKFLTLNIFICIFTFFSAQEVRKFFKTRGFPTFRFLPAFLGFSLPAAVYLEQFSNSPFFLLWLCFALSVILFRSIIVKGKEELHRVLQRVSTSFVVFIYPGLFLSFIIRIFGLNNPSFSLLFFFSLIFTNDILAYLFGKFFGKGLKLVISPHKSLAGFIAGFIGSVGISFLFYRLLPVLFNSTLIRVLLFGGLIGISTIMGDLIESSLKRSAHVKDSGTIMIGRGGMMDSIDSMLISAPLFYYLLQLIN